MKEDMKKRMGDEGKKAAAAIDINPGTESGVRTSISAGRPVLSLFALYARSSFRKILAVLAGLAIAEGVSFYMLCRLVLQNGVVLYPEKMIDLCFLKYFFLAALVLVYFILIVTEGDRGGCKSSYTLRRLRVSKKRQFTVKAVYNFLCLALVFALQILAASTICRLYEGKLPVELVSPQYLFLVFYRNAFLHCILPMADVGKWVCNFLLLLALALDAACGKRGGKSGERDENGGGFGRKKGAGSNVISSFMFSVAIYGLLAQVFVSEINSPVALIYGLYCLAVIGISLLRLFGVIGGGCDEEA